MDSRIPVVLNDLKSLRLGVCLDAQIVPDLAPEGPFMLVPVSCGLSVALTEQHSLTFWHRKTFQLRLRLSVPQPGTGRVSKDLWLLLADGVHRDLGA